MLKKIILFFLLGMMFPMLHLNAQQDASISPNEIRFWIGDGDNEVVFIVNWNDPDTALAWGYRFSDEMVTVKTIMDDIAAADERFTYQADGVMVQNLTFNNGTLDLSLSGQYWLYLVNGTMAMNYYDTEMVSDGDYVKWGDESCSTVVGEWNFVWTKDVAPVYPLADDATIAAEDILYWIGEGDNEVIFIVNWNNPNVALAWGYRFDGESVVVKDVMDAVAAEDARFAYQESAGFLTNLTYSDEHYNLSLYGQYWLYLLNGTMSMYSFTEQPVVDGDYIKWGDESCATDLGNWVYVWTQTVTPVTQYNDVADNKQYVLSMFPNPASDVCKLYLTAENEILNVSILDIQGRIYDSRKVYVNGVEEITLSVSDLVPGLYVISVNGGGVSRMYKLMVR